MHRNTIIKLVLNLIIWIALIGIGRHAMIAVDAVNAVDYPDLVNQVRPSMLIMMLLVGILSTLLLWTVTADAFRHFGLRLFGVT